MYKSNSNLYQNPVITRIYGHRGARGVFPENTMPGFEYLNEIGINAVELDVQITKDNIPIILHDPLIPEALVRDQNGNWLDGPGPKVIQSTLQEIQSYNVGEPKPGNKYNQRYPEQKVIKNLKIPTLESFYKWAVGKPELLINVEIKSNHYQPGLIKSPEIVTAIILDMSHQFNLTPRLIISSFDWQILTFVKEYDKTIMRGYLSQFAKNKPFMPVSSHDEATSINTRTPLLFGQSIIRFIASEGGHVWCPFFEDITPELVSEAHSERISVNVWTVNNETDITLMLESEVDGIISDYPDKAQQIATSFFRGEPSKK